MSKKKNTEGKVPVTKVEKPTTVKLNKTQRELFVTKRNQFNEGVQAVVGEYNKLSSEILGKLVDNFIEELGINIVEENWSFDANSMQFTKEKEKEKRRNE
jgi:hypothetical protein